MKTIRTITILTAVMLFQNGMHAQKLRTKIVKSISQIEETFITIPEDRKVLLDQIASRVYNENKNDSNLKVVFIDKNNKEKSQLAAIWLRTGLMHFGINDYTILSAGMKVTQEPFQALYNLEQYGFKVSDSSKNQLYSYMVRSGTEKWTVEYRTFGDLNLDTNLTLNIYVEEGITLENEPGQIEIPLFSSENIASEMLYVSSRIQYLTTQAN